MVIKDLRIKAGLTQQKMSDIFEIPKRTIENWEAESRQCPVYVSKLIIEKLEGMIMMNAKEVLKKASEIDEFSNVLPEVEVGEVVTLGTVWDGEGSTPTDSYSYQLTETDWINYKFEIVEDNEDELETLVKITDIELL